MLHSNFQTLDTHKGVEKCPFEPLAFNIARPYSFAHPLKSKIAFDFMDY